MDDRYAFGRRQRKRVRYKIAAGVMDFLGVCLCAVLFVALFSIMVSMINWFRADVAQTFSDVTQNLTDAVVKNQL